MPLIDKIEFSILDPETIKKMAVARITKAELYDEEGYPVEGGLMDPRLGTVDPGIRCRTCGGTVGECQGHFGYLELTKPIIHPHYVKFIQLLLKLTCRKCGRLLIDEKTRKSLEGKKFTWKDLLKASKKKCPHCKTEQKKIRFIKPYTFVVGNKQLTAQDVREWLEKIPQEDLDFLGLKIRPEWLVMTLLPIPPVTVRPSITLETGERSEDDLTHKLVDIVRINERLKENIELGAPDFIIQDLWELLQYHVSTYLDNEISGIPPARHRSGRVLKTLAQRLKTKEGRFRGNLLGKRVNFSARTVISPDPKIDIDEVGVPYVIAKELTIPVKVTERNLEEVKQFVLNGPENWPGANYVIRPDGRRLRVLETNKKEIAKMIEPGYVVERHLMDGDIVLFNRQPSLHRMSLMGHRVRVMPYKTFRINLSTCAPYNADFDGDEMNLHVPQSIEAQVETRYLASVTNNIRSPRYSAPIIGATRDEITGLYLLTKDDTKLSREEFVPLIRSVDIEIEIPNKKTMTGKEIFSLFLPDDLNIEYKGKVGMVKIENGKLVKGVVDKTGIGSEGGKIIDKIEKLHGKEYVKDFIFKVTKLAINYMDTLGFTSGISDFDVSKSVKEEIEKIIKKTEKDVNELIEKFRKGELRNLVGRTARESLETMIKRKISNTLNEAMEILDKNLKTNFVVEMARCGARGGLVNLLQISALVGQEMIMGERIERGYYKRTFPHFKVGTINLESKGFVSHGFKDGLTPFEFFFDAMNSREGLMDKSLKTRHSGYMERRLIGALQDLKVEYDRTVRDTSRHIVQFLPGEDGLDPSKIERVGIDVESIARKLFAS